MISRITLSLTATTQWLSVRKYSPMPPNSPNSEKKTHLARIGMQKNPEHQKNSGQPEKRVLRLYPESLMVQAVAKHTQTVI